MDFAGSPKIGLEPALTKRKRSIEVKLPKDALEGINGPLYKSLNLTRAEAAIVDLIMEGMTIHRILEETGLSRAGFKYHRCNIYKKLNIEKKNSRSIVSFFLPHYKFVKTHEQVKSNFLPIGIEK